MKNAGMSGCEMMNCKYWNGKRGKELFCNSPHDICLYRTGDDSDIEQLKTQIEHLESQKAALLAACRKAHQYFYDLNHGPLIFGTHPFAFLQINKHEKLMEKQLQSAIKTGEA